MSHAVREPVRPRRRNDGIAIDPHDLPTRGFLAAASQLARYHRHRVLHLERLAALFEAGRRVVLVGNHALDIVDPLLLLAKVYRELGRAPHFIGHENGWFRVPLLRQIAEHFQVVPSRRFEAALAALESSGFLMLFPGANREAAMRSYRERPYRLEWAGRTGYLKLALEADAELVFAAAVGCDEAYYQSRLPTPPALLRAINAGDAERYRGARLTLGLAGVHLIPGVFPLPVRVTHVLSEPLDLGDRAAARRDPTRLARLHEQVWAACQSALDEAVRDRDSDPLDRLVRGAEAWLQGLGV